MTDEEFDSYGMDFWRASWVQAAALDTSHDIALAEATTSATATNGSTASP
jgi:hypothetical protein